MCLVIGAGAGIGGHVARRFASEGYHAVLCRRSDTVGLQTLVGEIQEAVWMQKQRDDAAAHTRRVYVCARARAVLSLTRRSICVSVCMHVCVCVCVCACMHAHVLVQGGSASGSLINAVEPGSIEELVTNVERTVGPIHTAVYNLGAQVRDCQMCTGQRT